MNNEFPPESIATGPSQAELDNIGWWHTIEFPNGTKTKGQRSKESLESMGKNIFNKIDLKGKSVADIGAWNGYYSVEAVKRGALSITSIDSFIWERRPESLIGFNIVKKHMMPHCKVIHADLMNLNAEKHGTYDVTFLFGVLYHLKHPLYGLERAAELTKECLIVETWVDALDEPKPAAIFYPGNELNNDGTNWWGPNFPCVVGMLKTVGFKKIESAHYSKGRGIFHAWK